VVPSAPGFALPPPAEWQAPKQPTPEQLTPEQLTPERSVSEPSVADQAPSKSPSADPLAVSAPAVENPSSAAINRLRGDGQRVLDACAAPGGKSAHILEAADVELTAIDNDAQRLPRIEENLRRLGLNGRVALADAASGQDFDAGARYDRILIDAPCSATGVMRRHPDVRWLRRPGDIEGNTETQRRILESAWSRLEPGGLLVYASCSILRAENCEQIRAFIERNADAQTVELDIADCLPTNPGYQILPGSLDRDGFFYAGLRRL